MRFATFVRAAVLAAVLGTACREIDVLGESEQFAWGTGATRQLTYNLGRDGEPSWTPDGDSIYYSAEAFPGLVGERGVLLAIPAEGGTARPVFPFLHATQAGGPAYHVAPAVSPDGERVAYVDITVMAVPSMCVGEGGCGASIEPLLERGAIVVRDRDESSARAPRTHAFVFPGRAPNTGGLDRAFAYIDEFQTAGRVGFSIAWAPDGERLVFSDGIRLYLWQPDSGTPPQALPNSEYGVHPTWSPDGELIAFTRQQASDSVDVSCICGSGLPRSATRRLFINVRGELTVIRPDGSVVSQPGIGVDPAFGPDGALYASSVGRLIRIDAATGQSVPVAGGEGGYSPAPSPDGSHLAFMKQGTGGYDIWVVELTER